VVENGVAYLSRLRPALSPQRYVYVLDWEAAAAPGNERNAPVDYKIIENMKRHFADLEIVPVERFLASTPCFLIADAPQNLWVENRLEPDKRYRITRLGSLPSSPIGETMLLAARDGCPEAARAEATQMR
jgi:hypothetical protein